MAIEEDKWPRLLAKLIADTRDRRVSWTLRGGSKSLEGGNPQLPSGGPLLTSYFAQVDDKGFRLDLVQEKEGIITRRNWKLAIADGGDGEIVKRIPITSGLGDLARAIEDQISQVDEFLDKYLKS